MEPEPTAKKHDLHLTNHEGNIRHRHRLRHGFRARPSGGCRDRRNNRRLGIQLPALGQAGILLSGGGTLPPASAGLPRRPAPRDRRSGGRTARRGAAYQGGFGRHDGQHAVPGRPHVHAAGAAPRIRRRSGRDVRPVERPHGAAGIGRNHRPVRPQRDQLCPPFGQPLLGRMLLGQMPAPAARQPAAPPRRICHGRALRLDTRRAHRGGQSLRDTRQPLRRRVETDVGRGLGRIPSGGVFRSTRPRVATHRAQHQQDEPHVRPRCGDDHARVGTDARTSRRGRSRGGQHRRPCGSRRRRNPLRHGRAQPRHLGLPHGADAFG